MDTKANEVGYFDMKFRWREEIVVGRYIATSSYMCVLESRQRQVGGGRANCRMIIFSHLFFNKLHFFFLRGVQYVAAFGANLVCSSFFGKSRGI